MVKLYCLHFNECDPKKCTALKLRNLGILKIIDKIYASLEKAVILNPLSDSELSYEDRKEISNYGLIVIDCSWKKLLKFKRYENLNSKRLPSLIAANPVNYGKWEKLTSAEALATALQITGYYDEAELILSKFSWGNEFWKINKKILEKENKK